MKTAPSINFSKDPATVGGSGIERITNDFYATPPTIAAALLPFLPDRETLGTIWEPAAGDGAIVKVLQKAGYPVVASDLIDRGAGYRSGVDFLAVNALPKGVRSIITNPPYGDGLGEAFMRHALALLEPVGGYVSMLMRSEFLFAQSRRDLFTRSDFEPPLYVGRPRWFSETKVSPRFEFAWFGFKLGHEGTPPVRFARK